MNKKDDQRKQREQFARRRIVKDAQTGEVVGQDHPGYDVPMIRDFLEHLLLELRVQLCENQHTINSLERGGPAEQMPISEKLSEQLATYIRKYQSALITATAFDTRNATEQEIRTVQEAWLKVQSERRDEQIGHLEALQELFDEALACAKMPFGRTKDGEPIQPLHEVNVREWVDRIEGSKE